MSDAAVKPHAARRHAVSALRAAIPLCSGLVIVPKLRLRPPAIEPAIPNACCAANARSPCSLISAASAENSASDPVA
jgi:hypothetical protein